MSLNKTQVKFGIFVVGMAVTAVLVVVGISLLSRFIAAFQQGADPASIFRGHTLAIPEREEAYWRSTRTSAAIGTNEILPKRSEYEEMISAYWLAWDALGRAHLTGDTSDMATYWAGAAYAQAMADISPEQSESLQTSGHVLRLTFFSEDGSVVAFEDEGFFITRVVHSSTFRLKTSASVVMTLDQGFWRIRQITLRYS
ncbi:hypothetical protein G4Y79_11490 [Phototrophicus methaneseepsis]|uniref:Uncharacterized protein n=1 Tax=Phototrophicus methaneseepsis TaxID=2710758 RepID=A0A7S8IGR8_9CHLR|nr:hypothetical protein [Phototrophicus methaneseepsis]QPC84959.1 hypothetical protein G4Y79_11490 [Phototrophicus methaneseepsis]